MLRAGTVEPCGLFVVLNTCCFYCYKHTHSYIIRQYKKETPWFTTRTMLLSTYGQFHNCISPHHLFSLGHSALLSRFVLWLWWSWERKNRTRLKKKSVSGSRCQLCMEIVVFGPNPGIRCSREESFLGPRQSTIVAWELCVHAWVCVLVHACMHLWVRLSSPAFLPPLQHLHLRPSTSLFEYPVLHTDGVIKACPFPGWIAQKKRERDSKRCI